MSHDRLLTRVYDKKEKKMIYPLQNEFIDNEYNLLACNSRHLITRAISRNAITYIPFGDRFIPMQCSGRKDQNKKLIYTADIVKICDGIDCSYHEIMRDFDYPAFDIFPLLYDDCNNLQAALTELFVEVVGNKFENEEIYNQIKQ